MTLRPPVLQALTGGDRRSIGEADRVADRVLAAPETFADVVAGLDDPDPVVRMRSADVAEKVSRVRPDWLGPHTAALIALMAAAPDKEVRWHLAQMAPRLPLDAGERRAVVERLAGWLDDRSRIVQASALGALAELAGDDPDLRRKVLGVADALASSAAPALRARARLVRARLSRRP